MAEALVSTLLELFASIAVREAEQEIRLVVGVDTEVRKLEGKLRIIQAVLDDAEKRQLKDKAVKLWLKKFKDTSYEMDDVLDEWNTALIKSEIEKNEENAENEPIAKKRKVWSFFPSPSFLFRQVNKLVLRHDIAHKIKELSGNIDELFKERVGYGFDLSEGTVEVVRIKTTSLVDVSAIVGRDREEDALVRNLLGEGSEGERSPYVISLVGMGGIGKTSLAQLAYNNPQVQAHFEKTMWVCVSHPFNQCRVAKAILEDGGVSSNLNDLQTLLKEICYLIWGKKILLVLDDVWTEETTDWEPFKLALNYGAQGSKILVTTRNERVARMVDSASISNLSVLSEDDCWLIISKLAFVRKDEKQCEQLEELGRKLANKCKGLPLAAKTLGSLMQFKKGIQEWRNILDNNLWELEDVQKGLLGPLLLSYYEFPSAIKRCFIYCAVLPMDHLFSKNELVYLWMAQGFLNSERNIEMEIIGEEYFEKLVMRSFFQDFMKDYYDDEKRYTMHDIVHDFAKAMETNEYFTIDNDKELGRNCESARHMSLTVNSITNCPMCAYNAKNLRTLLFLDNLIVGGDFILPNLFQQLTYLRALTLKGSFIRKLPDEVEQLIHLRFLDLSSNVFTELPETMCNLCNLQTLDVSSCESLNKLPRGMGKLIKLRHLIIKDGFFKWMEPFPKGIGKLSSLRTLNQFTIGGMNDSEGCKLGELKNLNHLTGYLNICGLGNVIDVQEAENAELKKKVHLRHLDLWFYEGVEENIRGKNDELVLNALEPPPYLEILKIMGFKGIVYPNWIMSLTNLKSLLLNRCDNLEHFPSLWRLPFLESLEISNAYSVKKVGVEFLGIESNNKKDKGSTSSLGLFPNLKSLKFSGLEEWEEWHGMGGTREEEEECGVTIMPRLESLSILNCPKLKTLPNFLETTPLQELIMDAYQLFNFEHLPPLGKLPLLKTLKIKDADIVKKVGVEFLGIESNNKKDKGLTSSSLILFPNLKSLIFDSFGEWEEWDGIGGGGVTIMPRLESLSILNCPKLKALPNFLETTPLQDLHIDARISDWMTIATSTRLKELRLYLTGCINLEHLPPVGKLPFLEYLKVKNASFSTKDSLKKVGVEFLGIESNNNKKDEGSTSSSSSSLVLFPNLKSLEFENLEEWEEWDAMGGTREEEEGGVTIMPRLQNLSIVRCPKLKLLPDFLSTIPLKNLKILECPILDDRCRRQTGEEWSKISHIPTVQIDFFFVQVDGRNQFTEIESE